MADISKIVLPSGSQYNLKDAWARTQIEAITGGSAIVFKGVSTSALTDGGNENPTVGGDVVSTKSTGDLYFYDKEEFIYGDDSKWHALGSDLSTLGDLAYKDDASASYTPAGTVSQPTFTGASNTVTISTSASGTTNYKPTGSITGGTFTGGSLTSTGSYTPAGSVVVSTAATTNKTATVSTASGQVTYTPGGTVGAPTISVGTAGSTTTIHDPAPVTVATGLAAAAPTASAPANSLTYYDVTGQTLSLYQIGYTTAASITTSSVTVKTGDASYTASAPSWTGAGVRLVTGNIAVPSSFTGSFTGTEGQVSVTGTPTGTVSALGFSGDAVRISGTVTPSGTVSQPTFSGTSTTITVQ